MKLRKQRRIIQNNKAENAKRQPHACAVNDQVMVDLDPHRKHGEDAFAGPYTVTQVNNNGTVKLSKQGPHGAILETWNIRNIRPA